MHDFERTYQTGRAVCRWQETFGWMTVILGVVLAVIAPFTADFDTGGGIVGRLLLVVPGLIVAASGMMLIMVAQHALATMDTAEMTREILSLARNGQVALPMTGMGTPAPAPYRAGGGTPRREGGLIAGDRIKVYKSRELLKHPDGVSVDGQVYGNVIEAEKAINAEIRATAGDT